MVSLRFPLQRAGPVPASPCASSLAGRDHRVTDPMQMKFPIRADSPIAYGSHHARVTFVPWRPPALQRLLLLMTSWSW